MAVLEQGTQGAHSDAFLTGLRNDSQNNENDASERAHHQNGKASSSHATPTSASSTNLTNGVGTEASVGSESSGLVPLSEAGCLDQIPALVENTMQSKQQAVTDQWMHFWLIKHHVTASLSVTLQEEQQQSALTESQSFEEQLVELYTKYNPEKVNSVAGLLDKYAGHESELIGAVRDKYATDIAADPSALKRVFVSSAPAVMNAPRQLFTMPTIPAQSEVFTALQGSALADSSPVVHAAAQFAKEASASASNSYSSHVASPSPGASAGLMPGDEIIAIGGQCVHGESLHKVCNVLRGLNGVVPIFIHRRSQPRKHIAGFITR